MKTGGLTAEIAEIAKQHEKTMFLQLCRRKTILSWSRIINQVVQSI
jgi:hypothetical protein